MITKETCRNLRSDMETALQAVAEKYGMDFNVGNMRFTPSTVSIKVEAAVLGENVENALQGEFNLYCRRYGLSESDYGRQFVDHQGHRHIILGIKPRSKRYPILTRDITRFGTGSEPTTKMQEHSVCSYLG